MERPHRELRAGFANGLRGNDTYSFTDTDKQVRRQIVSVAFGADTVFGFAGEHGTDVDAFYLTLFNQCCCFC